MQALCLHSLSSTDEHRTPPPGWVRARCWEGSGQDTLGPTRKEMKLILQEVIQSEVNKGVITARKTEQAALPCEAGGPGSFPPRVTFRSRQEVI